MTTNEWKPIESAPRDVAFLGYQRLVDDIWVIAPMYFVFGLCKLVAFHNDNKEHEMYPSHWMEIPEPPKEPA